MAASRQQEGSEEGSSKRGFSYQAYCGKMHNMRILFLRKLGTGEHSMPRHLSFCIHESAGLMYF